ncbi:MAG: tetratricopeptide repeat protein [Methanobacteriaceae archaeon]|nr:tetratricopeptide repeat protein [Methanobacteriaceae archaeon]
MKLINSLGIMETFKVKKSLKYYQKKLTKIRKSEAQTFIDIGMVYLEENQVDNALKYYRKAKLIYNNINDDKGTAFTYDIIGDAYLTERNFQKAIMSYQESFKIYGSMRSSEKNKIFDKIKKAEMASMATDIVKNKQKNAY